MKKITTVLGLMGVVCLFSACSSDSDDIDEIVAPRAEIESSSSAGTAPDGSSASKKPTINDSSTVVINDSVTVNDTVKTEVVISSTSKRETPYYSSGNVFCWTKECEDKYANVTSSSSAAKSSSSLSIEINMSSEAPVYPTVTANQMIDQRDQQIYALTTIGGVHWMAENLKYKPKKGVYCDNDGTDMCKTYGSFYTYAVAQSACPTGWRLPTADEVKAADAAVEHEWWTIGGRFKVDASTNEATEYGLQDEQGYIWIVAEGEFNSWRVKNYDGDSVHDLQGGEGAERAYNVRCVEAK